MVQERKALHLPCLSRSNRASPILKAVWGSIICHSINQDPAEGIGPKAATASPNLILYVCMRNHGLVPPATRVERRGDVYQSPAERNNALPWLPSTAHTSLELHQSLREGTSRSMRSSLVCGITPGVIYCLLGSDRGCGCEWVGHSDQMSTGPFQGSPHESCGQGICAVSKRCGYPRSGVIAPGRRWGRGRDEH